MSAFAEHAEQYLALRRALGHKLDEAHRLLPRYVTYLDETGAETVTVALAMGWATEPSGGGPPSTVWGRRLAVARGFARHLAAFDPRTEVPPLGLLAPTSAHRAVPYLYSDAETAALMRAARQLPCPLRAATHETLIGLLAVTGMRIGEVIRLDRDDIDWEDESLVVRDSKFGKSRRLPLHATTVDALASYACVRDRLRPTPTEPAFFVTRAGTRLIYTDALAVFHRLLDHTGVGRAASRRPRPHDYRHSFAVATLLDWYREGLDVQGRMPWLSTYLGHNSPISTYWYLSAAPELMGIAAARLQATMEARP
jgi:integrase/recombinase XerD